MNDEDIKAIFLKKAGAFRLGKKITMEQSIQAVRPEVIHELKELGMNGYKAAVDTLAVRTMLIKEVRGK